MKSFQRLLVAAPAAALLPAVLAPAVGLASEASFNLDTVQSYSVAQATTIRDFSDVYPTDWAYQALSELVETYGCVSGFGDGTFRGQQPITRFEMAAILSSCLDAVSTKMDMMDEEMDEEMKMSPMEDMETLERLVTSFEEELITLKGAVDGLDSQVSELAAAHQFSTTTRASFEIATDFVYFASDDEAARTTQDDNSGLALSSEVEIGFETSFTGSDSLSFSLSGDLLNTGADNYLRSGDFYNVAGDEVNGNQGNASFGGFRYQTPLDFGGIEASLILGTDVDELDPIVGLGTYYGGSGYDDFGPGDEGDAGIGISVALLSSDAGTLTASAGYAVNDEHAANQTSSDLGIFGEDTTRAGALGLSWEGALFGGNDALFTFAYQNINTPMMNDLTKGYFHLVAGAFLTDTISLSGSYSFGNWNDDGMRDEDYAKWMIAANMDDAIFPGNSAGIAYGTPEYRTDPEIDDVMKVLELYYTFSINDNFEIPVYLDFISNVAHMPNASAFALAVRPTLTF